MQQQPIYILGIESSCDDTSAAVLCNNKVLANVVASQEVHRRFGGVVPELASRSHQANIIPVIHEALNKAKITKKMLNAIAFTRGPGLLGSLLVGTSFAKGLSESLQVPLLDVHHMQAHILAHFIENSNELNNMPSTPAFPFICLTVSGGHTQLVKVNSPYSFEILGETLDDAAGEAFDKAAKMLGLPYPGGPMIDKFAKAGNPTAFEFPHPQIHNLDFSFSGLKTSILYFLQKRQKENPTFVKENLHDLCASIQYTIVRVLIDKLEKASKLTKIRDIALAGGVSANSGLRQAVVSAGKKNQWHVFIPKLEYCTDNAAMIAMAGYFKYLKRDFASFDVAASARIDMDISNSAQ
ncbi:MAG: tRNA (adenosine(37)-N6)-threonylcarbamoyltransferase complex transferase subunit TsaD [Flavobacteriales bacterium]|nr:tRNA (adenosine(37)-N6)-threonylcarbamoyltransferase complex transferase subunit TsaD [Flavobacteriales bacterium]